MSSYWIYYALGLTGLAAWWANKERAKGVPASINDRFKDGWVR